MFRIALLSLVAGAISLAGCGRQGGIDLTAETIATNVAAPTAPAGGRTAKTPIVRALLQAIDEVKGESDEAKDELRRALWEADDELERMLGDNSRRLILDANRKPLLPVIGGTPSPAGDPSPRDGKAEEKTPVQQTAQTAQRPAQPAPKKPGEPQTRIVRALLDALDEVKGEDPDAVRAVRAALIEADPQLREVLGGNSQRLIQAANQKPALPVIGKVARPDAGK
jgi:hypothetical protein